MHLEAKSTFASEAMSSNSSATAARSMMQLMIIVLLTAAALAARTIVSKEKELPLPLAQQLRIWQCRQRCYHHMPLQPTVSPEECQTRPDCFMCHDYCRVLVVAKWSLARSMCADQVFCSRGCRTACQFHRLYMVELTNELKKA